MFRIDNIAIELENLNFTKLEANIYITLIKHGQQSGYQIAKNINISRSSVYPVLDELSRRGVIHQIPGETNTYSAEAPDILIEKLRSSFNKSAKVLKDELMRLNKVEPESKYINIQGFDNIVEKTKEMLMTAEKEVIMHTDFDLLIFEDEIREIADKGVRIIVFSWEKLNTDSLPIEFYHRGEEASGPEMRLSVVVDFKRTIIASNTHFRKYTPPLLKSKKPAIVKADFLGTFTENSLLVHMVAEHIHFDIYLLKLNKKHGQNLIDRDIQLGTIMEKIDLWDN